MIKPGHPASYHEALSHLLPRSGSGALKSVMLCHAGIQKTQGQSRQVKVWASIIWAHMGPGLPCALGFRVRQAFRLLLPASQTAASRAHWKPPESSDSHLLSRHGTDILSVSIVLVVVFVAANMTLIVTIKAYTSPGWGPRSDGKGAHQLLDVRIERKGLRHACCPRLKLRKLQRHIP